METDPAKFTSGGRQDGFPASLIVLVLAVVLVLVF